MSWSDSCQRCSFGSANKIQGSSNECNIQELNDTEMSCFPTGDCGAEPRLMRDYGPHGDLLSRVQTNERSGKKREFNFWDHENHQYYMNIILWNIQLICHCRMVHSKQFPIAFLIGIWCQRSSNAGFSKCTRWLSMMHIRELKRMKQCQKLGNSIWGCQSKWGQPVKCSRVSYIVNMRSYVGILAEIWKVLFFGREWLPLGIYF